MRVQLLTKDESKVYTTIDVKDFPDCPGIIVWKDSYDKLHGFKMNYTYGPVTYTEETLLIL